MGTASDAILIAIEGIDGAGKTTQVERLGHALRQAGEDVVLSKEPTDGPWGQKIRQSAMNGRMSPADELQAFVEDRREHVRDIVRPALDRGAIVILDRYFYSTIAYQGVRGADIAQLSEQMHSEFPVPDVVLLFDLPPELGLFRVADVRKDIPNTFERLEELRQSREAFRWLAAHRSNVKIIDSTPPADQLFATVGHTLLDTVLKQKRCAKAYDCDVFYCAYRIQGQCRWALTYPHLSHSSTLLGT